MPIFKKVRQLMEPLLNAPLHPQWLIQANRQSIVTLIENINDGATILDIGRKDKWPKAFIPPNYSYFGLNYLVTAAD